MSVKNNGKRKRIFLSLVEDGKELTPSEISAEVGETRQAVKYHLDKLVESGLVVRDDGAYYCQPVFADDEFESKFVDAMADLVTEVNERIEIDPEVPPDEQTGVVFNCIRMFIALEVLAPVEVEEG